MTIAKCLEEPAPFTKENFLNGFNGDSMLEAYLINVKNRTKAGMMNEIVVQSSERSMKEMPQAM